MNVAMERTEKCRELGNMLCMLRRHTAHCILTTTPSSSIAMYLVKQSEEEK